MWHSVGLAEGDHARIQPMHQRAQRHEVQCTIRLQVQTVFHAALLLVSLSTCFLTYQSTNLPLLSPYPIQHLAGPGHIEDTLLLVILPVGRIDRVPDPGSPD